jgi:hypothetical protein
VPQWLVSLDNSRFNTIVVALGRVLGDFKVKALFSYMLRLDNGDTF